MLYGHSKIFGKVSVSIVYFCDGVVFLKKIYVFFNFKLFFMFLNHFNVLISKINFKK